MVGGQAPKAIRSVECYDFEEDRWDQIAELPSRRCRAGERVCWPPLPSCLYWVLKPLAAPFFCKRLCIRDSLPFPSSPA